MRSSDQVKLAFYLGMSVHITLRRYTFSEEEIRIVRAAILTAKKDQPNMALIEKSDDLLKEVSQTREVIVVDEIPSEEEKQRQVSKLKMAYYKQPDSRFLKQEVDNNIVWIVGVVIWAILAISLNQMVGGSSSSRTFANGAEATLEKMTFEEAEAFCMEKEKVLPLIIEDAIDFLSTPDDINTQGYWSADSTIIYNIKEGYGNDDGQEHHVVCVKKNSTRRKW